MCMLITRASQHLGDLSGRPHHVSLVRDYLGDLTGEDPTTDERKPRF